MFDYENIHARLVHQVPAGQARRWRLAPSADLFDL